MVEKSSLNLAIKYLSQKQFQKAENILSNLLKTFPFDENIVIYYGYSLIEQRKYEDALVVYRKYLSINSEKYRLLRAYCYAKMGFIEKALTDWLKLSKEGNKIATSILSELKKAKDNKTFIAFLKYNKACGPLKLSNFNLTFKSSNKITKVDSVKEIFSDFQNNIKNNNRKKIFVIISLLIVITLIFSLFIIFNLEKSDKVSELKIDQKNNTNKSNIEVTTLYLYDNKKQIEKDINLAKKYISQFDYNNSRLLLNKIIYSNAEEKYKQKAENLEYLLSEPLINKLTFNPQYNEVIQNPLLYLNLFVQWKAIVYELLDDLNFSVMVYSKNPIYIDGISLCVLPKPFPLFVKQQVEIFGKILKVLDSDEPKIKIEIKNIKVIYE